jgi:multidrug transporter EmrE-like cation transporter
MAALTSILAMTCAETFGNVNLKKFAQSGNAHHPSLVKGVVGYAVVLFFLIKSLSVASMLYVGAMWEGMVTVIGSLVAYFYLGERFSHWSQYLGLVLAVLAMILVHKGGALKKQ